MSGQIKKGLMMSIVAGVLLILYQSFPDHQGIIVFSSFFGLALTSR